MNKRQISDIVITNIKRLNNMPVAIDSQYKDLFSDDIKKRITSISYSQNKIYYFKSSSVVIYEYKELGNYKIKDYSYKRYIEHQGNFNVRLFHSFEEAKDHYNSIKHTLI